MYGVPALLKVVTSYLQIYIANLHTVNLKECLARSPVMYGILCYSTSFFIICIHVCVHVVLQENQVLKELLQMQRFGNICTIVIYTYTHCRYSKKNFLLVCTYIGPIQIAASFVTLTAESSLRFLVYLQCPHLKRSSM